MINHLKKLTSIDEFRTLDYVPPKTDMFFLGIATSRWKIRMINKKYNEYFYLNQLSKSFGYYCFWLKNENVRIPLYVGSGNLSSRIREGYFKFTEKSLYVSYSIKEDFREDDCEKELIQSLSPIYNKQHNQINETYLHNTKLYSENTNVRT